MHRSSMSMWGRRAQVPTCKLLLANIKHGRADIRGLGLGFRIRDLGFRVSKQTMGTLLPPLATPPKVPLN